MVIVQFTTSSGSLLSWMRLLHALGVRHSYVTCSGQWKWNDILAFEMGGFESQNASLTLPQEPATFLIKCGPLLGCYMRIPDSWLPQSTVDIQHEWENKTTSWVWAVKELGFLFSVIAPRPRSAWPLYFLCIGGIMSVIRFLFMVFSTITKFKWSKSYFYNKSQ